MRARFSFVTGVRVLLVLVVVIGSAVLVSSSDTPEYTTSDRAYYADANTLNFVRPGLVLRIASASIADDGTIKARVKMTDLKGLGLDREGITTPGAISTRFVIGYIPAGQTQYSSYITRKAVSNINGSSATQVTYDSNGTWEKLADGDYNYTFAAKAPAGFDKTVTHAIGVWGARDLSEFDLQGNINDDSNVFTFVPNGSAVTVTRDVVRTQSCNRCHDPLQAHDERRGVELCIICHQPQTTDPDTGNTVNFPVMIHKIHDGEDLPSVIAGKPYQIIGYRDHVVDFSTVAFPADVRRCEVCHDPKSGAAQADAYLKPNRAACGACHDNVNFATGENHANLPQISDKQCTNCHLPQGDLEFDTSIKGAHTIPEFSRDLPGTTFQILDVKDGVTGKRPTVAFKVTDKKGNPFDISKMRLALTLAGPATDYPSYIQEAVNTAQGPGDGTYFWTFKDPIAADAKGTYAVEIEGYRNWTLQPGTEQERTVRDAGISSVMYFSVDGSKVQPRRQVVSLDKCDNCHVFLSLHGGNRNRIEACVMCHNPNGTDAAQRPKDQGAARSIDFANMIHRIHTGEESTSEIVIYGHNHSKNDFGEVRFPGDRRNCNECHVNGSEQPPLKDNLLQVQNPRGLLNPMGPTTAACTGCHTSVASASHALSNTTQLGEACAACHSTTSEFAVPKVHAR